MAKITKDKIIHRINYWYNRANILKHKLLLVQESINFAKEHERKWGKELDRWESTNG